MDRLALHDEDRRPRIRQPAFRWPRRSVAGTHHGAGRLPANTIANHRFSRRRAESTDASRFDSSRGSEARMRERSSGSARSPLEARQSRSGRWIDGTASRGPPPALRTHRSHRQPCPVVVALPAAVEASAAAGEGVQTPGSDGDEESRGGERPNWHVNAFGERVAFSRQPPAPFRPARSGPDVPTKGFGIIHKDAVEKHEPSRKESDFPVGRDVPDVHPRAPDPHHYQQYRHHRAAPLDRLADSWMWLHEITLAFPHSGQTDPTARPVRS